MPMRSPTRRCPTHVSSCVRCTGLVEELGALRASLAELPDLRPHRPLRLLPEVEPSARRVDRLGGWARRLFAPVLTAGAALAHGRPGRHDGPRSAASPARRRPGGATTLVRRRSGEGAGGRSARAPRRRDEPQLSRGRGRRRAQRRGRGGHDDAAGEEPTNASRSRDAAADVDDGAMPTRSSHDRALARGRWSSSPAWRS